jgi:prepilin-type N-terminal cleavage/methylation domain-containing protein
MKKLARQKNGFTIIEVMIVVAIIALLAAIAIPNFILARQESWRNQCRANLEAINSAKIAACDAASPATPALEGEAGVKLLNKVAKRCPADGTYSVGACGQLPTCNIVTHLLTKTEPPKNP